MPTFNSRRHVFTIVDFHRASIRCLASWFVPCLLALISAPAVAGTLAAFPGAEGFGAVATGGRGGQVLIVTNLAASGPGSLQAALDTAGPRIVVFRVSGVIEGDVAIPLGDVTIAGQTAPGAGITIHGHLHTPYDSVQQNIIIRHLRVRPPLPDAEWPPTQHDAILMSEDQKVILDHVSASHGVDETIDMWNQAREVTIQWSSIALPVMGGGHPDGAEHNYGVLCGPGGGKISIHHNLFAHAKTRTPALAEGPAEVRNNVVYNGREGFVHHNPAVGDFNLVGNLYLDGPSAALAPLWFDPENDPPPTSYYSLGHWVDDPGVFIGSVDNPYDDPAFGDAYTFACCGVTPGHFVATEIDFSGYAGWHSVATSEAADAYDQVLLRAGAWPRDIVDTWVVDETRTRTGSWGDRRPADWLEGLVPDIAPQDGDNDGMADAWETVHGLDPADGTDHMTIMPSDYTAIEEYVNELADRLVGQVWADGFETGGLARWSAAVP